MEDTVATSEQQAVMTPERLEELMLGNLLVRGIIEDLPRSEDQTFSLPTIRTRLHIFTAESDDDGIRRVFMHARHSELHTDGGGRVSLGCLDSLVGLWTYCFPDDEEERERELGAEIERWKTIPPWMSDEMVVICRKVGDNFLPVPIFAPEIIQALARLETKIAHEIKRPNLDMGAHNQDMLRGLFYRLGELVASLNAKCRETNGATNLLCSATCMNLMERMRRRTPQSISAVAGAASGVAPVRRQG